MFAALFVRLFNHLLQQSSWAARRLHAHAGKHFRVEAGPLIFNLTLLDHGRLALAESGTQPDVILTLPADAPVQWLIKRNALFAGIRLSGNADLAEDLAFVFRNLSWDAESDLANWLGDIPARRLAKAGQRLRQDLLDASQRGVSNALEYATYEAHLLPGKEEMARLRSGVVALRDDLARLEKRLARL